MESLVADEVYVLASCLIDSWNQQYGSRASSSYRPFEIERIGKSLFAIKCSGILIGKIKIKGRELVLTAITLGVMDQITFFGLLPKIIKPEALLDEMWEFLVAEMQMSESPEESDAMVRSASVIDTSKLSGFLANSFNVEELMELCHSLNEDFEKISSKFQNKRIQSFDIVTEFKKQKRICDLLNQVCKLRPNIADQLKESKEAFGC